jgi:hypothetical protein
MTVSGKDSDYRFVKAAQVDKEGIYYTMMAYAPYIPELVVDSNVTNQYSAFGDDQLE